LTCPVFKLLFLVTYLKNIKFQIVGVFVSAPENRMVCRLGAVFYLTKALMGAYSRFSYGFGEQLGGHEMRAGAGG